MTKLLPLIPVVLLAACPLAAQFQTRLGARTDQAFEDYRRAAEGRMDGRAHFSSGMTPGQILVVPAGQPGPTSVPDGLIHDWIAAVIVPGATVNKTLAVLQNYPDYKIIYRGDVSDSKLLQHDGDRWRVALQMVKKQVLTVVLNGEFEVQYRSIGDNRWSMTSRSTRIAEMDGDQELPPGRGHGFLWHMNAYWIIEPRPEGVYLECRAISLSRDIPFVLSLAVKPFITSVPRESLQSTMEATIRALR